VIRVEIAARGHTEKAFDGMNYSEDQFRMMVDNIPTLAWSCRSDGTTEFLNQRWLDYTGLSAEEALGWGWKNAIHAEDVEELMNTWLRFLAAGEPGEEEARLRRFYGLYRWFLFLVVPIRDEQDKVVRWYGTNTDIEDRKRAEALLAAEKRSLEMIANGASLTAILEDLCNTIDAQALKTMTTVLLMDGDGKLLWPTAGPRVPGGWSAAITPLAIGPRVGSCGTAAYLKKPVITTDIANDPSWAGYQDLALSYGLRAAWSQPLIAKNGADLGTFAMYFAEPRSPSDSDVQLIEAAGHIALIAIERKRAEEELRRSETYLAEAQRLSLTGSFGWNVSTGELVWSEETFRIVGYERGTKPTLDLLFQRIHPEDRSFVQEIIDRAMSEGTDLDFDHRVVMPNGFVKHLHVVAHAVRDELGKLEFVGAVSDVTAKKHADERHEGDQRQIRRIIDAIPQHIIVLGPEGTVLYGNCAALEYTGVTAEQFQSREFYLQIVHPEDLERIQDEVRKGLARGFSFELEHRSRRKDGQYRWFLVRYKPLRDENGQILRWYATGTDIEDHKRAEERMENENLALREEIDRTSMFEEIVGSSEALRTVLLQVAKVAPLDSTVLILGETGTGKELVARAIHKRSNRSTRPFMRVNCAAIPPSLIASELFGHEKGAFTGALQRRLGRFESANGGTIFLDEIGDLPADTQIALLRVLQEREFERVGSSRSVSVDVRVLAATNHDLKAAVAAGTFREDLFYRLNVFPIHMPSLRDRVDDIPLLVEYLIDRYAKKTGKRIANIEKKTLNLFQTYKWPGNVRELQNVVERAVILCDGETFSVDESWLTYESSRESRPKSVSIRGPLRLDVSQEREMIEAALAESGGRISGPSGAAARLGIPRQTLESKIANLGINKHRFKSA
jgi:PAS domain S-box-containing protein